jgi:acyl-coenzyme A synthetase/AMP-(fatty) acid ligase
MTGFIEKLHDPQNADTALCIEGDRLFCVGDLRSDIDRLCPTLSASSRIAIHCQSARLFLIAITAAWRAGATVIFPATDRPAYLDGIVDQFDLYLDDTAILAKATTRRCQPHCPPHPIVGLCSLPPARPGMPNPSPRPSP